MTGEDQGVQEFYSGDPEFSREEVERHAKRLQIPEDEARAHLRASALLDRMAMLTNLGTEEATAERHEVLMQLRGYYMDCDNSDHIRVPVRSGTRVRPAPARVTISQTDLPFWEQRDWNWTRSGLVRYANRPDGRPGISVTQFKRELLNVTDAKLSVRVVDRDATNLTRDNLEVYEGRNFSAELRDMPPEKPLQAGPAASKTRRGRPAQPKPDGKAPKGGPARSATGAERQTAAELVAKAEAAQRGAKDVLALIDRKMEELEPRRSEIHGMRPSAVLQQEQEAQALFEAALLVLEGDPKRMARVFNYVLELHGIDIDGAIERAIGVARDLGLVGEEKPS